jgi:multiple sugar transport system permease protein
MKNTQALVWKTVIAVLKYITLCLAGFAALFPLITIIITAFKSNEEYASTTVTTLPQSWFYFGSFITSWQRARMGLAFANSTIILVFVLSGSILLSSMIAFVLNRFKFTGNALIRSLFLFAALIPGVAMQVTVYQIMYSLGLINSLVGYIILMLGTDVISIYIFLQFFVNLPVSLDESAIIDGCTYYGVFFKILFPLLQPAMVTSMILKGVGTYNEYYMANLYLQDKNRLQVVATSLYSFTGPMGNQYNYICAGVIITIIPALIIFIACQKQIYAGLTNGAVKG